MALLTTFWIRTVAWGAGIASVFTMLSLLSGGGVTALSVFPGWLALGLVLGTYPAGIAVSKHVLGEQGLHVGQWLRFSGGAAAVCAVVFVLAGFIAPMMLDVPGDGAQVAESRGLSLPALRTAIEAEAQRVDPQRTLEPTTIADWFPVNRLLWDYFVRLTMSVLPFFMSWIGVAAAFWVRQTPARQLHLPQLLGLGFLLVVYSYLSNENSFEWVVVQAAGPVPFAGTAAVVVPSLVCAGLLWPLALLKWKEGIVR